MYLLQPQLIVSSPTPTASPSTTISNGTAPSLLVEVDSGISTTIVAGYGEFEPLRGASAQQLQRSVSDSAETTVANARLMQTTDGSELSMMPTSRADSLMHDLSLLDATKL